MTLMELPISDLLARAQSKPRSEAELRVAVQDKCPFKRPA